MYFDGLHLNEKELVGKGAFFRMYYEKAFFERVRNIVLSKFLLYIKDSDKGLRYLKLFGLEGQMAEIEQQVDNLRYQMSKKQIDVREQL